MEMAVKQVHATPERSKSTEKQCGTPTGYIKQLLANKCLEPTFFSVQRTWRCQALLTPPKTVCVQCRALSDFMSQTLRARYHEGPASDHLCLHVRCKGIKRSENVSEVVSHIVLEGVARQKPSKRMFEWVAGLNLRMRVHRPLVVSILSKSLSAAQELAAHLVWISGEAFSCLGVR